MIKQQNYNRYFKGNNIRKPETFNLANIRSTSIYLTESNHSTDTCCSVYYIYVCRFFLAKSAKLTYTLNKCTHPLQINKGVFFLD